MIITCEKCYAKFNLDENLLKQSGSKVRCSKCQNIFLAYPPTEMEKSAKPDEEMKPELEELLGLALDTEPVAEEKAEDSEAVLEIEEEELDLSDIEEMFDIEEKPKPETEVKEEPEELEFELDAELVTNETPEEAEEEPEPEAEAKEEPEKPDLEFELEGVDEEETKKEVEETVDLGSQADQAEAEEVEKTKKRISTPVLVALIIALLTGGAYGAYVALESMNIKIPFISDLVEPAVQDEAGNLKIMAFDIVDKFIDNSKSGKLFIVSGKVKNGYSGARSFIRVTGKLYAKEGVLLKTAIVCCGNVLSDQDLSNMDMNSINKRLLNLFGDNKSNLNIKPGKELPFMMVFPNIPDNIKEYTVEVVGSSPA